MEFWQVLAVRRREIGMRYDDLCEKSNIPVNTLKKVLTGMVPGASFESIRRISQALGMSLAEFESRMEGTKAPGADERAVLDQLRVLDIHGRAVVNAVLKLEVERTQAQNVPLPDGVYPLPDDFCLNPVPLIGEAVCTEETASGDSGTFCTEDVVYEPGSIVL